MTTEASRRELAVNELKKIEPRLQALKLQLEGMEGDGAYVVYTGKESCPVFVRYNATLTAIMPNIGLEHATRLYNLGEVERVSAVTYNGNREVAHFCTERKAREMEIALLESVHSTFERVANGLPA